MSKPFRFELGQPVCLTNPIHPFSRPWNRRPEGIVVVRYVHSRRSRYPRGQVHRQNLYTVEFPGAGLTQLTESEMLPLD